jgi:hypothetical protein
MNCDRGFFAKLQRLESASAEDPRGAGTLGADLALHTSHEGSGVTRALHCLTKICPVASLVSGQPTRFCPDSFQLLTDVGPVELWATH